MQKLDLQTPNFTNEHIEKLAAMFPHCVTESRNNAGQVKKVIDFDLLKQELSANIVDGQRERYQINWPGKRQALIAANTPINKTLRPCREESVDFDSTQNLYIEGDNLEALKLLQESYLNKVKMIYIDPPYNTGKDFVYKDNFTADKAEYELDSEQRDEDGGRLVANPETNGRYHSDWLSMIYPRLRLARNLLKDDGVIFISIDDGEQASLKRMCDDIFGEENHLENFIWHKKNSAKGVPPRNMVVNIHEYILCYSKTQSAKLFGEKRTEDTFSNPDNDPRGLWRRSNIKSTLERSNDKFSITDPESGLEYTNFWAFSKDTLQKMINENRILFPKKADGLPKQKEFLNDFSNPNMPIMSHLGLFHSQDITEKSVDLMMEDKAFLYRKPVDLIKKIIEQGGGEDSYTVIDFFSGSATTAHAVMQLNAEDSGNRKFIMMQLPEETDEKSEARKAGYSTIAEIGKERIRRAGKKIKEDHAEKAGIEDLDIGFRVLKIDSSNMNDVYYSPDELSQDLLTYAEQNIKADRTAEDLLFQVLLDWGVDLSLPIVKEEMEGKAVYFVDDNALAACFADGVDEALVKALAKREVLRVVFKDTGFAKDEIKDNVDQIFKQLSPETEVRAI